MKQSTRNSQLSAIAVFFAALSLAGCSKESDNLPEKDPALQGVASVSFAQVSMTDFDGNPVTRADGEIEKQTISQNVGEQQGFILETQQGNGEKKAPQTRANIAMTNGTRYRVVIYKDAEYAAKTIYQQQQYQAGSSAPVTGRDIKLPPGSYKVFAYSYNTKTDIPELKASSLTVNDGNDFLSTDVANLTINSNQLGTNVNYGTLTFKRRCCNIWVKVETVAYTNTAITACTVKLNNLPAQATWTVGGTTFTQVGNNTSKAVINNQSGGSTLTKSAICLPVGSCALTMDYYFKTNAGGTGGEKTFNKTNQPLTSTNFTTGNQYLFTMTGIGAYVPTIPYATIGGLNWAPCNQSGSGTSRVANPWDYGYYYTFVDAKNACPSNKQPTAENLQLLPPKVAPINTKVYINKKVYTVTGSFGYIGVQGDRNSSCIFMDGNNVLCLPAADDRIGSGADGRPSTLTTGNYWSSSVQDGSGYSLSFYHSRCHVYYNQNGYGLSVRCLQ